MTIFSLISVFFHVHLGICSVGFDVSSLRMFIMIASHFGLGSVFLDIFPSVRLLRFIVPLAWVSIGLSVA
jgi:hypothetical protein